MTLSEHEQNMYAAKVQNGKHGIVPQPERGMAERIMELHWELSASVEHERRLLNELHATIAERDRLRAIARAAVEYRQVNTALDNEPPHPHPDPLAHSLLIRICEQKRAALFAAVDGEKTL